MDARLDAAAEGLSARERHDWKAPVEQIATALVDEEQVIALAVGFAGRAERAVAATDVALVVATASDHRRIPYRGVLYVRARERVLGDELEIRTDSELLTVKRALPHGVVAEVEVCARQDVPARRFSALQPRQDRRERETRMVARMRPPRGIQRPVSGRF